MWDIDKNLKSETGHGTQKPVECMRRPIENNSSRGQAVYDPFCGSGTTIIAAEQTGRACHAIEIAPAYVDVAVKRWQAFTGLEAKLDGDGRSFEEIALERAAQDRWPEPASRVAGMHPLFLHLIRYVAPRWAGIEVRAWRVAPPER